MNRFAARIALVTGGASGLGLAIAQRLASEGAQVVISDIQADAGAAAANSVGATFLEQDVTDETQWTRVVETIVARFGNLHILVNNAGILGPKDASSAENSRYDDWKRIFAVNVDSVFLGCRAALPALARSGGGAIVNISSVAALVATPNAVAYGASKAAVRQLTKSVAQHCALGGLPIRCNSVHPGNVRTPLLDRSMAERARQRGLSFEQVVAEAETLTPLGALTLPEDIAAAVAFLASDDARHITGEQLIVDGGAVQCDTFQLMKRSQAMYPPARSDERAR